MAISTGRSQVSRIFAQVDEQISSWRTKFAPASHRAAADDQHQHRLRMAAWEGDDVPPRAHTAATTVAPLAADCSLQITEMRSELKRTNDLAKSQGSQIEMLQQKVLECHNENIELRARLNLLEQVVQSLVHSQQQTSSAPPLETAATRSMTLDIADIVSLIRAVGSAAGGGAPPLVASGLGEALRQARTDVAHRSNAATASHAAEVAATAQHQSQIQGADVQRQSERRTVFEIPSVTKDPHIATTTPEKATQKQQQHPQQQTFGHQAQRCEANTALVKQPREKPSPLRPIQAEEAKKTTAHPAAAAVSSISAITKEHVAVEQPRFDEKLIAQRREDALVSASRTIFDDRVAAESNLWHHRSNEIFSMSYDERAERRKIIAVENRRREMDAEMTQRRARGAVPKAGTTRQEEMKPAEFKEMAVAAVEPQKESPKEALPDDDHKGKTPGKDPFDSSSDDDAAVDIALPGVAPAAVDPPPTTAATTATTTTASTVAVASSPAPKKVGAVQSESSDSEEQDPFTSRLRASRGRGRGRGGSRRGGIIVGLAPSAQPLVAEKEQEQPEADAVPKAAERKSVPVASLPSPDVHAQPPRAGSKESDDDFVIY